MPRPRKQSKKVSIKTSKRRSYAKYPSRTYRRNPSMVVSVPKTPFRDAGREIGGIFGMPNIGGLAGSAVGRLFGSGAYKITNSAKMNTILTDAVPEFGMTHTSANSIRIKHREYLSDVSSSVAYTTQGQYYINPGLSSTFPWLSQIASSFQQYKIHGLCAVFKSTSADAVSSTNAAVGTVMISFNFNPTEALFTTKQQQLETDFCCDEKPTVSFVAPMECARGQTALPELYVRQQGLLTTQNQQFYDMALMQVATQGSQAVFTAGELWLTYDIELIKPITNQFSAGFYTHIQMTAPITTSAYFGASQTTLSASNMSGIAFGAATITFPSYISSGKYLCTYVVSGGSTAVTAPTITATSGCVLVGSWNSNAASSLGITGVVHNLMMVNFMLNITAPSAVITFSGATLPGSSAWGDLHICSVPTIGTS